MNHIRAGVHASSWLHRLLLAVAVIAGLLAMHTLASSLPAGHAAIPTATAEHAAVEHAAVGHAAVGHAAVGHAATPIAGVLEAHCAGDCGSGGHSMLSMVCVLALLVAAIVLIAPVLLAPALLARFGAARALLSARGRSVLAALPHPRPPSLLVLSISRI